MPNTPARQPLVMSSIVALRLDQTRVVNLQRVVTVTTPQFAQDQVDAMHRDTSSVVHTLDQKSWVTLAGWLDLEHAVVQCRRTGLTVKINRKDKVTAGLLPMTDKFPKATLQYSAADGSSARQNKERELESHLNVDSGSLVVNLAFKGGDVYDEVLASMTAAGSDINVKIEFAHPYQVQVRAEAPTPPPQPRPQAPSPLPAAAVRTPVPMARFQPAGRPVAPPARARPAAGQPLRTVPAAPVAVGKQVLPPPPQRVDPAVLHKMVLSRVGDNRVMVPPTPPPGSAVSFRDDALSGQQLSIPIAHAQAETDIFPDLKLHAQSGWGQVPEHPKLHYLDSPRADTFFYLPTSFKLGCYSDIVAGPAASRLPMQVELYPGPDGNERIKATLVALPCVEDQERDVLRSHLCDDVLQGQQPFVNLEMKSGMEAAFIEDFTAGTETGQQSLPSNIACQPVEVVPDQRLVLRFDMPAASYSIFCEILRFGIFGKVKLSDSSKSMEALIDVRLQLQDLITNQLKVELVPPDVPKAAATPAGDSPDPAAGAGTLKLQNLLDFPVIPSSVKVHYLDVGKKSRLVFEVETATITLPDSQLPPQSDDNSAFTLPTKPQKLVVWDTTVVETGQLKVDGGTPDDWLNRVNRDPSLQPHDMQYQLQPVISPAIQNRVQLMRLRLFRAAKPKVLSSLEFSPASPAPKLKIPISMEQLAVGGVGRNYSVEYETVAADGNISLPQRVAINPDSAILVVQAIVETPKSIFTFEYEGEHGITRQELDREGAAGLIDQLRSHGKTWTFSVKEPPADAPSAPTAATTGTSATTTATNSSSTSAAATTAPAGTKPATPAGPEVTVVTDLAALGLRNGTLQRVFIVLKPPTDDAGQQSSFVLDSANPATFTWQPQGFAIPPFRYEITYLYKGNQVKQTSGTSSNLALILDPPSLT